MKTTTDFQLVNINKLIPYANNARTHNKEQILKLRSSLREFGFVNPVIIDRNYNVLAGHGRIEAAKAEGIAEVPCVYADHLTEAQKKAYILADNRMALDAGWDDALLAVEMEELQNLGFDLGLTGFDEKEIADLFDTNGDDVKDDDFDLTAALEKAAFVQCGDIWTVGRHRLMCGDATNPDDVSALMGDTKANLILTDPPYNVSFKSGSGLTIQNDSMKNDEFYTFLLSAFKCMADHLGQYRTIDIKRDSKTKTPSQKAESIGRSIQITSHRHTESDRRRKSVSQIQIRQCEHNIQFGSLFSQTSVSCFPIPKNIFYN